MVAQTVPLLDLKAQYATIKDEIDAAVASVISSQHFILGPEVEGLERELAEYCGAKHCVALSSGTDALLAAFMALGIGPGDEVITTPYSFFATAGCIARAGAKPVFADIDPATFNIDPARIEACVNSRTRAIVPVDLYGQCADIDPINAIAAKHGLAVVADAAQSIGAEYKGKRAGSLATISCFSFFPSKNLGGFGDGGAVTTDDPALFAKLKCIRTHGETSTYRHAIVGANFRIDGLQAAVLRVKLRHLE
ncbi:MAG TPA: DegT/DnrJ/EryC1/StrS family aminotransferase, partial [Planctomycetia bacterium]|nr:DegT/DnrJ/EryC1/StrS family aminotransferase [Planctomycetia bacterium]